MDEEYDTEIVESTAQNTELKASKTKNCLGESAKQKDFEHSWDMRPQQSSHQQIMHAPSHNNFSGFNNNRSRDRIPRSKRVITKRALSYQRDDDRGRKRHKVDQNDEDHERTNKEERCTFVHRELPCKYYHTVGMKCFKGVHCRFSHGKLNEEQKRKILKNNLEKKPILSMQTYDQPFFDDVSDDDESNGLVIDEEHFQDDVKDKLLPEKQNEPLNNNGNSYESEEKEEDHKDGEIFDEEEYTNNNKLTEKNTETKELKLNCVGDGKEEKLKYFMVPCEVSIRDYSDIPPTMGVDDPRLRNNILAAKDPIQNFPVLDPPLQTPNPPQPPLKDIDMRLRHKLPPIMPCPQTMAILNDSRRKVTVPRDPMLKRHRFDVDQRLNNI